MSLLFFLALSTIIPMLALSLRFFTSGREQTQSNVLLGSLFFVVGILTVSGILLSRYEFWPYFPVAHLANLSIMLLGPLLFLYSRSMTDKKFRFSIKYALIFLPFILVFLIFLYMTLKEDVFYGKHNNQIVYKVLESFQNAIYYILIPVFLKKSEIPLKSFFLDFRNFRLTWLRLLYFSSIILWLNKLYTTLIFDLYNSARLYLESLSLYFLFSFIFCSIVIYIAMKGDVFLRLAEADGKKRETLSETEKMIIYENLSRIMISEEPYLDPDLTLGELSRVCKVPMRNLSRVINDIHGCNFNDYVNEYRLKRAICFLDDSSDDRTITEVFLSSGFNSKSTFNTYFKKIMGMTPREYRYSTVKL